MKNIGSYNYTNQTSQITVQHPSMRKYCSNVHKIGGAHLQCMDSHYTKFEYKGIKTLRVNNYTKLGAPKVLGTNRWSGHTTRIDFVKATEVKSISCCINPKCNHIAVQVFNK